MESTAVHRCHAVDGAVVIRLAHAADSHVSTTHRRWPTLQRVLRDQVHQISDARPDVILHAGDLGEPHPSADDLKAIAEYLTGLASISPVVVCAGNHDSIAYWPVLARLSTHHPLRLVTTPEVLALVGSRTADDGMDLVPLHDVQSEIDTVRLVIHCMPWPARGWLLARLRELPPPETTDAVAADLLRQWFIGCRPERELAGYTGPSILLAHLDVHGARLDSGQPQCGPGLKVGREDLLAADCTAVCLGHVHARQEIDGIPEIQYAGSPCRLTWGEAGDAGKGWSLIEIDDFGGRSDRVAVKAMDVPSTHLWTVEATWSGTWLSIVIPEDLEGGPSPDEEVRVRYEVPEDQRAAARADEGPMLARLADGIGWNPERVTWERVTKPSAHARVPEIATDTDPVAMFDRWAAADGQEIPDDRRDRLHALIREVQP